MVAKTGRIDLLFKFVVHFSDFYSADQLIGLLMKRSESEGTVPIGLWWHESTAQHCSQCSLHVAHSIRVS